MISVRPTKSRFTFWTAAALLAVIVALALPQSALAAPDRPTDLTATALDHDTVSTATLNPCRVRMSSIRPVMSLVPVWVT